MTAQTVHNMYSYTFNIHYQISNVIVIHVVIKFSSSNLSCHILGGQNISSQYNAMKCNEHLSRTGSTKTEHLHTGRSYCGGSVLIPEEDIVVITIEISCHHAQTLANNSSGRTDKSVHHIFENTHITYSNWKYQYVWIMDHTFWSLANNRSNLNNLGSLRVRAQTCHISDLYSWAVR